MGDWWWWSTHRCLFDGRHHRSLQRRWFQGEISYPLNPPDAISPSRFPPHLGLTRYAQATAAASASTRPRSDAPAPIPAALLRLVPPRSGRRARDPRRPPTLYASLEAGGPRRRGPRLAQQGPPRRRPSSGQGQGGGWRVGERAARCAATKSVAWCGVGKGCGTVLCKAEKGAVRSGAELRRGLGFQLYFYILVISSND